MFLNEGLVKKRNLINENYVQIIILDFVLDGVLPTP